MPPFQRKTLNEPNADDPLSERTIGRRVWAGYLRAGYNRATFARALKMSYQGLYQWDTDKTTPDLKLLIKACDLIGYSINDVCYGHYKPAADTENLQLLSRDGVHSLVLELKAADRAPMLSEFLNSNRGSLIPPTRLWIETWLTAIRAAFSEGMDEPEAVEVATQSATKVYAKAVEQSQGVKPASPERLSAIAKEIRAVATKSQKPTTAAKKRRRA